MLYHLELDWTFCRLNFSLLKRASLSRSRSDFIWHWQKNLENLQNENEIKLEIYKKNLEIKLEIWEDLENKLDIF